MATYLVNGLEYKSKAALQKAIRAILERYQPGQWLGQSDFDMIYDVLAMHPKVDAKMGAGVQAIGVRLNTEYRRKEFFVRRVDGSETEFSYLKCLQPPTHQAEFTKACRELIAPGIITFKTNFFRKHTRPVCQITGERLTMDNSHVDHVAPNTFRNLLDDFIRDYGIDIHGVELISGGDNVSLVKIADEGIAQAWTTYHWKRAQLRVISAEANLSLARKVVERDPDFYERESTPEELAFRHQIRADFAAAGYTQIYPLGENS